MARPGIDCRISIFTRELPLDRRSQQGGQSIGSCVRAHSIGPQEVSCLVLPSGVMDNDLLSARTLQILTQVKCGRTNPSRDITRELLRVMDVEGVSCSAE